MYAKGTPQKPQLKELDRDRVANIQTLQRIVKLSTVFILVNIALVILVALKAGGVLDFEQSERIAYFGFAIINVVHVIAIVILCVGTFTAKEQIVWAFLAVNAIYILLWASLLGFLFVQGQAKYAGLGIMAFIILYGVMCILLEILIYFIFARILKFRDSLPPGDKGRFNVLNKTAMISDMPILLGQKGQTTTDASVTEVTLRL